MNALGTKLREGFGLIAFWCPGCDEAHRIRIGTAPHPCWSFNGNVEQPTFAPSINVTGTQRLTEDEYARVMRGEHVEPRPLCCHSFVRDGLIQFLSDCTHSLRDQTVPLPPWPSE